MTLGATAFDTNAAAAARQPAIVNQMLAEIPGLRRTALWYCRAQPDHAQDLVQETLMRALQSLDQWRPGTNMRAWLTCILRNQAIASFRRTKGKISVSFDLLEQEFGRDPEQSGRLELMALRQAWLHLSDEHQQVLKLIAVEGLPYQEVAMMIGVKMGTVRSRLFRARAALAEKLS